MKRARARRSTLPALASLAALAVAACALGCASPVAGALDEIEADRVVVALDRRGIVAAKEPDPASEGRFRVSVERDDASRAIAAMREDELPSPPARGVLDALGSGSLVPSPLAERARWVAGVSGELERTLGAIDGVASARVHLSLPEPEPFAEGPRPRATASVLVKHRGPTAPIDATEVQRLVAGAAPGLAPGDVAVVMAQKPQLPAIVGGGLAHLGPIATTRSSLGWLRAGVALATIVDLALVGAVLFLWQKLRAAGDPHEPPRDDPRSSARA